MTNVNRGKQFEKQIQSALEKVDNIYVQRLYDTMNGFKNIANPCDYIVYSYPNLCMLECKSCHGSSFSKMNISDYQYEMLLKACAIKGIIAGYMIWFIDKDITVFVRADEFEKYLDYTNRKSLAYDDALRIGFEIKGKKRTILYDYDMEDFIKYVNH